MSGKCRFCNNCSLYYNNSIVCNHLEGFAYNSRWGGCYRDLAKHRRQSKYWREPNLVTSHARRPILNPVY